MQKASKKYDYDEQNPLKQCSSAKISVLVVSDSKFRRIVKFDLCNPSNNSYGRVLITRKNTLKQRVAEIEYSIFEKAKSQNPLSRTMMVAQLPLY